MYINFVCKFNGFDSINEMPTPKHYTKIVWQSLIAILKQ